MTANQHNADLSTQGAIPVDIPAILSPIPGKDPGGESLRYDAVFDQMRKAREEDDPSLPQGVWERPLKKADWDKVVALGTEVLIKRSKDLQIAVWLAEGLVQQKGLLGAHEAFLILSGLVEHFWDELYPRPLDGDLEHRLGLFNWLANKLPRALINQPVTWPTQGDIPVCSLLDWERVLRDITQTGKEESDAITLLQFNKSVEATAPEFYRNLFVLFERAEGSLNQLNEALEEKIGEQAPPLHEIRDHLQEGLRKVVSIMKERNIQDESPQEQAPMDLELAEAGEAQTGMDPSQPILTREQAYLLLDRVADFLMEKEPHSPTPYLLKRVSRWGEMSLMELLKETITGFDDRSRYKESFFINHEEEDESQ